MRAGFETTRVIVRTIEVADAADLFALDRDPDVLRYTSDRPLRDLAAYRAMIRDEYLPLSHRNDHFGYLRAEERATGAFLGWFCFHRAADAGPNGPLLGYEPDDIEVGYRLRRGAWGRGIATEVTTALVARAFEGLGAARVVAATSGANLASIRVLEKSGLLRVPGLVPLPGVADPFAVFALDRPGWTRSASRCGLFGTGPRL